MPDTPEPAPAPPAAISRRRLLGTAGATGAAGLAAGATGGTLFGTAHAGSGTTPLTSVGSTAHPFHGPHQAGITSPLQAHGHLIAYDLDPGTDRRAAAALLRRWSATAAALMAGRAEEADGTHMSLDAGPCALTLTFGFGAALFDTLGMTDQRPTALAPLPEFSNDALDRSRSDGELFVQIGADDALVALAALRAVRRAALGTATPRWQMTGFNRTPGATAHPMSQRNLMGQIDGTNNPLPGDDDFDRRIFVPADGDPPWMAGGSYAVVRRIRMLLDTWEDLPVADQERVIGRRKADGAPLGGDTETTPVDLTALDDAGNPVIPVNAHVRVSSPETNDGAAMLRRPFSYQDGLLPDGAPDAGLLFICWQADPLRGFVPVQRKLDRGDALSPFLRHEASGLFAVPGGAAEGEYVGQALFEG